MWMSLCILGTIWDSITMPTMPKSVSDFQCLLDFFKLYMVAKCSYLSILKTTK